MNKKEKMKAAELWKRIFGPGNVAESIFRNERQNILLSKNLNGNDHPAAEELINLLTQRRSLGNGWIIERGLGVRSLIWSLKKKGEMIRYIDTDIQALLRKKADIDGSSCDSSSSQTGEYVRCKK